MRQYQISRESLEVFSVVGFLLSFITCAIVIAFWSFSVRHHEVIVAKHHKGWKEEHAYIYREGTITVGSDRHTSKPVIIGYRDYFNQPQSIAAEISPTQPDHIWIPDLVNKSGDVYFPHTVRNQEIHNPTTARGGWFPIGNLIIVGIIANAAVWILFWIDFEDLIWRTWQDFNGYGQLLITLPSFRREYSSIFGMKRSSIKRVKYIHTSKGELVKKEYWE